MKRAFEITKTIRPGLTPKWSISEYTTIHDHYDGNIRKSASGLEMSVDVIVNGGIRNSEADGFRLALAFGMLCLKENNIWRDELGKVRLTQQSGEES